MAFSKIGFHVGVGGNHDGLADWMRRINGKGRAFGLKSTDSYGQLGEALTIGREHGVSNWLVYRSTKAARRVSRETPIYTKAPVEDAVDLCGEVLSQLPPEFDKTGVWLELINEPRAKVHEGDEMYDNMNPCDYLGEWCLAAAQFLNEKGYKFAGPAFNSGEPGVSLADAVTQYSQPGMLKYLRYCAHNPTMAALALHEYSWSRWRDNEETAEDWYPHLWGRFEAAIAAADIHGIPRTFPIFITEFGFAHNVAPRLEVARPMLDARNKMLARWPQVKFDAAWALQKYGSATVHNDTNTWMGYDVVGQWFDEGTRPAKTHEKFGGTLPGQGGF